MEITKYKNGEILYQIRHDMRELPDEKLPSNEAINPQLTKNNYSIISRGKTAKEINNFRKQLEKEIFSYKRKDIVHDIEYVFQCPSDCPPDQKEAFFQACYDYTVSTLPMGEKCVFVAEVHTDEKHKVTGPDGVEMVISKDHLHMHVIPAVPDTKHEGYKWRLCADQLTRKSVLRNFHPSLQKYLDEHGIHATVYKKKNGDGKSISLSVKQLKEISAKTGIVLDHSLTTNELAEILQTNILKDKQVEAMRSQLAVKNHEITGLKQSVSVERSSSKMITQEKDSEIRKLNEKVVSLEEKNRGLERKIDTISTEKEKEIKGLKEQLSEKDKTITETRHETIDAARIQQELHEKESEITDLKSQISSLQERTKTLEIESVDKDTEISKLKTEAVTFGHTKESLEEKINSLERDITSKDKEISDLKDRTVELAKEKDALEEKAASVPVEKETEHSVWGNGGDGSVEWGSGDDSWGNPNKTIDKDVTW